MTYGSAFEHSSVVLASSQGEVTRDVRSPGRIESWSCLLRPQAWVPEQFKVLSWSCSSHVALPESGLHGSSAMRSLTSATFTDGTEYASEATEGGSCRPVLALRILKSYKN